MYGPDQLNSLLTFMRISASQLDPFQWALFVQWGFLRNSPIPQGGSVLASTSLLDPVVLKYLWMVSPCMNLPFTALCTTCFATSLQAAMFPLAFDPKHFCLTRSLVAMILLAMKSSPITWAFELCKYCSTEVKLQISSLISSWIVVYVFQRNIWHRPFHGYTLVLYWCQLVGVADPGHYIVGRLFLTCHLGRKLVYYLV